jgi:hypothetical protein
LVTWEFALVEVTIPRTTNWFLCHLPANQSSNQGPMSIHPLTTRFHVALLLNKPLSFKCAIWEISVIFRSTTLMNCKSWMCRPTNSGRIETWLKLLGPDGPVRILQSRDNYWPDNYHIPSFQARYINIQTVDWNVIIKIQQKFIDNSSWYKARFFEHFREKFWLKSTPLGIGSPLELASLFDHGLVGCQILPVFVCIQ